jgi:AT-binding transcription factor 1
VVQVWFQNARAKEKKNKIALQKALGGPETSPSVVTSSESSRPPEECKLCQFRYSHKYSIQDHIFTKKHIDNVKAHIESGRGDTSGNTSDGGGSGSGAGEFTVPPVPGSSGGPDNATVPPQPSPQFINNSVAAAAAQQQQLAQLQMLQMAAASGLALPNSLSAQAQAMAAAAAAAAANSTKDQHGGSKSPAPGSDEMALLHQLYGLGLAGFPGAMQASGLFLHPAMFSTSAGE